MSCREGMTVSASPGGAGFPAGGNGAPSNSIGIVNDPVQQKHQSTGDVNGKF